MVYECLNVVASNRRTCAFVGCQTRFVAGGIFYKKLSDFL
jgi:hypothetical protein